MAFATRNPPVFVKIAAYTTLQNAHQDLLYISKDYTSYRAPQWVQNVQHIVLKSQGLCNIAACVLILKQIATKIEAAAAASG